MGVSRRCLQCTGPTGQRVRSAEAVPGACLTTFSPACTSLTLSVVGCCALLCAQTDMKRLEAVRLELDSRRRTVGERGRRSRSRVGG